MDHSITTWAILLVAAFLGGEHFAPCGRTDGQRQHAVDKNGLVDAQPESMSRGVSFCRHLRHYHEMDGRVAFQD